MSQTKEALEEQRRRDEAVLNSGPRSLWQSIGEFNREPVQNLGLKAQEFGVEQKPSIEFELPSLNRRSFMQWMAGAGALIAGSACKRREKEFLVPYVHKPQGFVMGQPVWYASSAPNGMGILIKTREGKPIKLEGNSAHPFNQGGLDVETQSTLLDLFNPERLKGARFKGKSSDLDSASQQISESIRSSRAGGVRVLSGPILSPTLRALFSQFLGASKGRHHGFVSPADSLELSALSTVVARPKKTSYRYDKADLVVSLDADFLGADSLSVRNTKLFSSRRKVHRGGKEFNRLVVFESQLSLTGANSDLRIPTTPASQFSISACLLYLVARELGQKEISDSLSSYSPESMAKNFGLSEKDLIQTAKELVQMRGRSIVVAGGRNPLASEIQLASFALNLVLGNIGKTVDLSGEILSGFDGLESSDVLLEDLEAGRVDVLLISGANPVFHQAHGLSADSRWVRAIKSAKISVFIGQEDNETAQYCDWVLGESHFLESWGDSSILRGIYSVQQPVIEPLFSTRALPEWVLSFLGSKQKYSDFVKDNWKKTFYSGSLGFDDWWMEQLKLGYLKSDRLSQSAGETPSLSKILLKLKGLSAPTSKPDAVELVVAPNAHLRDGTKSSNAWIQELPEAITKVVWHNYAAVSPQLAERLGLRKDLALGQFENDTIRLSVKGKSIELPALIQPGLKGNIVAVPMGYGRSAAGSVGTGIGKNIFELVDNLNQLSGYEVEIAKTGKTYPLATTQRHYELHGRDQDILQQTTLADFLAKGSDESHEGGKHSKHFSLYNEKEFVYPGHRWGMAIDLNSCTGCNACVVACYSENNIGIVGEDQTMKGRHMAWLRLDLYYQGSPENPEVSLQPMLCQQCERAPCETVCPVLATVHSSDGLNDMVYNRCVGTRYCANNCPYKVRRFNYFQYTDSLGGKMDFSDPLPLMLNPDVTVRSRGVMEKCTFCVQRIRKAVDEEKQNKQPLKDGTIQTACQQSCPADAIVFGDLNDPNSEVSRLSKNRGGFKVLEVLNTKPSVTYLPRVRNKGMA